MLQKCMRSCNLCGDLVDQKDRIQPTSKKPSAMRRPGGSGGSRPNSEYNDFQNYYNSMVSSEGSSANSTPRSRVLEHSSSSTNRDSYYRGEQQTADDHYNRESSSTSAARVEEDNRNDQQSSNIYIYIYFN